MPDSLLVDSLLGFLRRLERPELAALLRARPDVLVDPTPSCLRHVAVRLCRSAGVEQILARCDLATVQVAEAVQAATGRTTDRAYYSQGEPGVGPLSHVALVALAAVQADGAGEALDSVLQRLREQALVWPARVTRTRGRRMGSRCRPSASTAPRPATWAASSGCPNRPQARPSIDSKNSDMQNVWRIRWTGGASSSACPPHGIDALTRSAIIFDKLRAEWAATLGVNRLADLEDALRTVAGSTELGVDTVSWFGT